MGIMTHTVYFVGSFYDTRRYDCSVRIDEVGGLRSATLMRSSAKSVMGVKSTTFSDLELGIYDLMIIVPSMIGIPHSTVAQVYQFERVAYERQVVPNEFGDINKGPYVEEKLVVSLSGGWDFEIGENLELRAMSSLMTFDQVFGDIVRTVRRDISLGGLLD